MIYTGVNIRFSRIVDEICAGIEEEGVRYEINCLNAPISELAYAAANASAFGCGIGIDGNEAVLQLISFKKGEFVFHIDCVDFPKFRILGENAARTLKKQPYIKID